jgi:hypothetical protein
MPDPLRLYLDQCLRIEVAQALRHEGCDVVRAAEVGQYSADGFQIIQHAYPKGESSSLWTNISEIGRCCHSESTVVSSA